jgi:hypothetical protein
LIGQSRIGILVIVGGGDWTILGSALRTSPAHTPESLNCESIVDPDLMQLIYWQFQV